MTLKYRGFIEISQVYKFNGFTFEYHRYFGPHQLRKDGELRQRFSRGFWRAIERWEKLPKKQKERTRI